MSAIQSGPDRRSTPHSRTSTSSGWTLPKAAPWSWSGASKAKAAQPLGPRQSRGTVDASAHTTIRATHPTVTASRDNPVSGIHA